MPLIRMCVLSLFFTDAEQWCLEKAKDVKSHEQREASKANERECEQTMKSNQRNTHNGKRQQHQAQWHQWIDQRMKKNNANK